MQLRPPLNRQELEELSDEFCRGMGGLRVGPAYLRRALQHFIGVGIERGVPPPAQLLRLIEVLDDPCAAQLLDTDRELTRLRQKVTPEQLADAAVARVLEQSERWLHSETFANAWFEDDARVDQVLNRFGPGQQQWLGAVDSICSEFLEDVLENKRHVWIERLIWMTLWAESSRGRSSRPWHEFFVLACELDAGRPLAEIPMMQAVAERTLHAAIGRCRR